MSLIISQIVMEIVGVAFKNKKRTVNYMMWRHDDIRYYRNLLLIDRISRSYYFTAP